MKIKGKGKTIEIEVGKIGLQTDGRGISKNFTPEFFNEVAKSYDTNNFKAPAIISHDTKGIPDDELHKNKELSYGIVQGVKVAGDRLKLVFDKLSPTIKKHFKEGNLIGVSPSFYPPNNQANPTPGKWSLRHVAFLGKTPPAIKGLAAPEFSESGFNPETDTLDFYFPVDFQESEESLNFSIGSTSIRQVFSNLRDWLIETQGKELAEQILPSGALNEIAMIDRYHQEEINNLYREVEELRSKIFKEHDMNSHKPVLVYAEMKLGKKIAKLAEEKGISRVKLADAAGITEGTVSQIINGDIEKPPMARIKAIAKMLGVSVNDLVPEDYEDDTVDMGEHKMKNKKKKSRNSMMDEDDVDLEDEEDEDDMDDEHHSMKKKRKTLDLAEQLDEERRQRKRLQAQVLNNQRIAKKNELIAEKERLGRKKDKITVFCETLVKDGYLPASQKGDRVIEFGEEEATLDLPDFMMTLDDQQLSFMENFLQSQPKVVEYEEFAPDDQTIHRDSLSFSLVSDGAITDESNDEYQQVLLYCEQHSLDPDDTEAFDRAAQAVLK